MKNTHLIAPAIAALILAGCDEGREDARIVTPADEVAVGMADDDAYPVGGTMTPQQQDNFENFDRDAAVDEYTANRSAMGMGGADDAATGAAGADEGAATGAAEPPPLPPRSEMDFAFLDRNGDGRLSVGEYAIWAVRANPATAAPNDENRPFISTEQVNEAGQTFFFFDEDGDSYLSSGEFDAARSSARTP